MWAKLSSFVGFTKSPESAPRYETAEALGSQAWEWPSWCLQRHPPLIEVFVIDEDEGSDWVKATPCMRVVNETGRDSHLCAEYEWGDATFMEDFGPERVRRIGDYATVLDLIVAGIEQAPIISPPRQQFVKPGLNGKTAMDDQVCAVCMDAPSDTVLLPCLHGSICETCALQVAGSGSSGGTCCPLCRAPIQGIIKVQRNGSAAGQLHLGAPKSEHRWPSWCLSRQHHSVEVRVFDEIRNR